MISDLEAERVKRDEEMIIGSEEFVDVVISIYTDSNDSYHEVESLAEED